MYLEHFNSHPHEEDDISKQLYKTVVNNFNSHPHEEDDSCVVQEESLLSVFQLTSSRRG